MSPAVQERRRTPWPRSQGLKPKNPAGRTSGARKFPTELTFAVLETFPGARLAVFLALTHTRVSREEALGLENGTKISIKGQQRSGNAMAHGARLTIRTAAANRDVRIEFVARSCDGQWLASYNALGLNRKIIFKGAAIDQNLAGPGG